MSESPSHGDIVGPDRSTEKRSNEFKHHRNSRHFAGRMKGSTSNVDHARQRQLRRPAPYDASKQRRRGPTVSDRLSRTDDSGSNASKWPHDKSEHSDTSSAAASAALTNKETASKQHGARETDPKRLMQRQKQIDFGKNTTGYDLYRKAMPKHKRTREHPQTPDKHAACSKRAFAGRILQWRKALHAWDPEGESINEKIGHLPEATKTNDMDSIDSLLEDFERNKHEYDVAKDTPKAEDDGRDTAPANTEDFEEELRKAMDEDVMVDFDDDLDLDL